MNSHYVFRGCLKTSEVVVHCIELVQRVAVVFQSTFTNLSTHWAFLHLFKHIEPGFNDGVWCI